MLYTSELLKSLSTLGKYELKRRYLLFLNGDEVNGISWTWINTMLIKGYITQEDMNYIVY